MPGTLPQCGRMAVPGPVAARGLVNGCPEGAGWRAKRGRSPAQSSSCCGVGETAPKANCQSLRNRRNSSEGKLPAAAESAKQLRMQVASRCGVGETAPKANCLPLWNRRNSSEDKLPAARRQRRRNAKSAVQIRSAGPQRWIEVKWPSGRAVKLTLRLSVRACT